MLARNARTMERDDSAISTEGVLAFGDPAAEQKLASSLSTAGGEIRVKRKKEEKPAGLKKYYAYSIVNANGEEFAILRYEWKSSNKCVVTAALPDGSVVWSDQLDGRFMMNASAGDSFGLVQTRWNTQGMNTCEKRACACGGSVGELMADGQPVLSFVAPSQPWLIPFLTLTLCMGGFCLPPKCRQSRIMRGNDCVGTAIGAEVVKSDDPAILRASINILAILNCLDDWKNMQQV